MRVWLSVAIGTALLGLATLPAPVLARRSGERTRPKIRPRALRKKRMSPSAELEAPPRSRHRRLVQSRHLLLLRQLPRRKKP